MKICSACKSEKSRGDFYKDKRHSDGLCSQCKYCESKRKAIYAKTSNGRQVRKNSEKRYRITTKGKIFQRKQNLKRFRGITLDEYDSMLSLQGGVCAICGTAAPGGSGAFHVDHDHNTNKIRGLLCVKCNPALGGFKDSIDILLKAARYLETCGAIS
jgi:hypothetical protein